MFRVVMPVLSLLLALIFASIIFFKPPLLHAIFFNDISSSSCISPHQVFKGIISIIKGIKVFILFKSFSTTS